MKKIKIKMNEAVYLSLSILKISKKIRYEFWYDYIKLSKQSKTMLHEYSFIIYIKTKDVYEDVANDVENRFETSDYEVNIPLPTGKNKKVIGLMKDEVGRKIMTKLVAL